MHVKRSVLAAVAAAGALTVSLVPALTASADTTAKPDARKPRPPLLTVAEGLDNPRGLAFAPDGSLYVAEAGRGGRGPCQTGPEGDKVCFGRSGAITKIRYGRSTRVISNLPSLAAPDGSQAGGPADVGTDRRGTLSWVVGLGGDPALRDKQPALRGMAQLYERGRRGPQAVADLGAYERRVNPDGVKPADTNPNGLAVARDGRYVVDAGGNSLLRVDQRGKIRTVAVFPQRFVKAPAGVPGVPAGKIVPMQSVPTAAVRGPDGAWYVSELTGFPFPAGQARVYRVEPGQKPRVYATGLTNVIDLAWGPGGLYALEISHKGLLSGDDTGALVRVNRHGTTVVASEGLHAPGGVAIRGRDAYVTNHGTSPRTGTVVKIRL
ncbi:ScyD/ScyE family protein [Symbioplanes lichenis]|uniref:ScyD/ScyE family protein n=1 Tax=Symbioplanes lichenis TaxID=1629072 RepID=UPI00273A34C7|nr:ScyD/ScyE family protein [Actinoplanes lichenis]